MKCIINNTIPGPNERLIVYDLFYDPILQNAPIIIFCHGYKGFKDWGAWSLLGKAFVSKGFAFFKFNFSHNGGTLKQPIDFPDLEAFAQNNYTKELQDLDCFLQWLSTSFKNKPFLDLKKIILIGHSRGGGIVTIKASEDPRIHKLITLAGVSDFKSRFPTKQALRDWSRSGRYFVKNGRTQQQMPHAYQFYLDFLKNEERLTISSAAKRLKIPHLIVHGAEDTSVPISEAKALHRWSSKSSLCIFGESNHVFGAEHPWKKPEMPANLKRVLTKMIDFINN